MSKKKIDFKELKTNVKALNKLELNDEPVEMDDDVETLTENFISAIEEIDDAGKIDEVESEILDFYETLIDDDGDNGKSKKKHKDEDEDEDEKSTKKKSKTKDDEDDDEEEDEKPKKKHKDEDEDDEKPKKLPLDKEAKGLLEELEEVTKVGRLQKFADKNDLDVEIDEDGDLDEEKEKIEEAIKKASKKRAIKKAAKAKDDDDEDEKPSKKKAKKDEDEDEDEEPAKKKSKDDDGPKLPKGIKNGTINAKIYQAIDDEGETKLSKILKLVAKEVGKEEDQVFNKVIWHVTKKISPFAPIRITFDGKHSTISKAKIDE